MGMGYTKECRDGQSNGLNKHDRKIGLGLDEKGKERCYKGTARGTGIIRHEGKEMIIKTP